MYRIDRCKYDGNKPNERNMAVVESRMKREDGGNKISDSCDNLTRRLVLCENSFSEQSVHFNYAYRFSVR